MQVLGAKTYLHVRSLYRARQAPEAHVVDHAVETGLRKRSELRKREQDKSRSEERKWSFEKKKRETPDLYVCEKAQERGNRTEHHQEEKNHHFVFKVLIFPRFLSLSLSPALPSILATTGLSLESDCSVVTNSGLQHHCHLTKYRHSRTVSGAIPLPSSRSK